jgi:hypothetical protein
MSLTKLPSGRWRARVWHQGKDIAVGPVLGLPKGTTWRTKGEAKAAREKARAILKGNKAGDTTVGQRWERWTSDPLFARPKESTNVHNKERTQAFAQRYGSVPLHQVGNFIVAEWLAGGGATAPCRRSARCSTTRCTTTRPPAERTTGTGFAARQAFPR